ncbi:MAG TPA: ATP-binding protein [Candidatus Agathobaculum merdavium]|nr:ATP-binding protein [Candidatus Agathobaculum merdavium]
MGYDKKLLAEARRELERERASRSEAFEERRREVYARESRVRAIDRTLSQTAAAVLKAALNTGGDPAAAIEGLRQQNLALQAERAGLLSRMGLPADYLTEKPLCEKCGDTGYAGSATCDCVKTRYARLLREQLSTVLPIRDQNFARFNMEYYSTRPDKRLGLSPRENMEYNLDECKAYAKNFGAQSPNLLLYGSTGLGKTFLSSCIAEAVAARGFSVAYDTAINIVAAYETIKFGGGNGEEAAERAARYERADLLIIDDMGTEMGTAFTVSALYNLINNRLMARRPMIVNTNLPPEALSEKYSPAVASRLLGEFISLRFFGDDIRLLKKQKQM